MIKVGKISNKILFFSLYEVKSISSWGTLNMKYDESNKMFTTKRLGN